LSKAKPITSAIYYAAAVTNCRRNVICGGCFFFKVNLADRRLRDRMGDAGFFLAYDTSE
jgi:hypothetical protein